MLSITPSQRKVSDRFPVASFVVHVPGDRLFEIACATDPVLFRGDQAPRRTPQNFFTSRGAGLLRAPAGEATYLLPSDQLRRFAGHHRIYYSLGAYRSPTGDDPVFTHRPDRADGAPFIAIASDFSGRTLDRRRALGGRAIGDGRYGTHQPLLAWGGDLLRGAAPLPAHQPAAAAAPAAYDDGYPGDIWQSKAQGDANDPPDPPDSSEPPPPNDTRYGGVVDRTPGSYERYGHPAHHTHPVPTATSFREQQPEPPGYEDGRALRSIAQPSATYGQPLGEPAGFEDGCALRASQQSPQHAYGSADASFGEPDGAEDAPDLFRRGGSRAASYGGVAGEPDGAEDAPALARMRGVQGYGAPEQVAQAQTPVPAPASSPKPAPATRPMSGVDDHYDDEDTDEGELVARPWVAAQALATVGSSPALTIKKKFEIIVPVAKFEGGPDGYAAINADSEFRDQTHTAYQRTHYGLHWGLMQFNQRSGALGKVLLVCQRRDPVKLREVLRGEADRLLQVTNAARPDDRLMPVAGAFLWDEPWLGLFRQLSAAPAFQNAQNEVAIERWFDSNLGFASAIGFNTDRAFGMLYDRTVNMGRNGGRRFVLEAISPIKNEADRDAALKGLGFDSVAAFQRSVPGLEASGRLGPKTMAALFAKLGEAGSAMKLPPLNTCLDLIVKASLGRRFEARVSALRTTQEYADVAYQVP